MKNLSLFLLLCLLFVACAKDEDKEPILVTDIVMPTQTSFNPGDKVTISAQGFQPVTTSCSKYTGHSPTSPQ